MKAVTKLYTPSLIAASLLFSGLTMASPEQDLKTLLNGMQAYKANFSQTVTDSQGEVVHEAEGQLTMARPDKLRWETQVPDETLLIADGKAVWNIDPFVEQVTVIDQSKAIADNPVILLTTQDEATWQKFAIDGNENQFTVSPKDGNGQIKSLSLTFSDGVMTSLSMLDAQDQQSQLKFSDVRTNFSVNNGVFTADVPDSYMIDDQR